METKVNTFRDEVEVENIKIESEVRLNQKVHTVHLRAARQMAADNQVYLAAAIESRKKCIKHVGLMADCECKSATIGILEKQITDHETAMVNTAFNGVSEMTLDALQRLEAFELESEGVAGTTDE